jgi:hypothetical protein
VSEVFTVEGQVKPVRFSGTKLAEESTETESSLRWLELELYRVDEGPKSGQYLLHRVGQSVVFHKPNACGYGVPTVWQKVPDDAEPCSVCQPVEPFLSDAGTQYEVWLESSRHKVIICPQVSDLERALLMKRKDGSQFLSTPATNLLLKAREHDLKISQYFSQAVDI